MFLFLTIKPKKTLPFYIMNKSFWIEPKGIDGACDIAPAYRFSKVKNCILWTRA